MVDLYGIPNCDTVKKARLWLQENNIAYTFHDFKKEGISKEKLKLWLSIVPLETLTNKKSAAWKSFTTDQQTTAGTKAGTINLMCLNTSFIKRPVLEFAGTILCGFTIETYKKTFDKI